MRSIWKQLRSDSRRLCRRAGADEQGAAVVEFALIAMVILVMISAAFDISRAVMSQRDAARASVELARSLAQCVSSSCLLSAGQSVMEAKDTIYASTPGLNASWAYVSRTSGGIVVSFGNMTYLPNDVKTQALDTLDNNDNGVCTLVTYDPRDTILGLFPLHFNAYRYFHCALQSKDVKMV
jgi:Flp pilus assembly protein TadG